MWQNVALDLDPLHKDDTNQHDTSASFMKLFIQQVFNYDSAKMIEWTARHKKHEIVKRFLF